MLEPLLEAITLSIIHMFPLLPEKRSGRGTRWTVVGVGLFVATVLAEEVGNEVGCAHASRGGRETSCAHARSMLQVSRGAQSGRAHLEEEEQQHHTSTGTCSDGSIVQAIASHECPQGISWRWPNCERVAAGAVCEADGECGTSDINNCGIWDMYVKSAEQASGDWCRGAEPASSLAQVQIHGEREAQTLREFLAAKREFFDYDDDQLLQVFPRLASLIAANASVSSVYHRLSHHELRREMLKSGVDATQIEQKITAAMQAQAQNPHDELVKEVKASIDGNISDEEVQFVVDTYLRHATLANGTGNTSLLEVEGSTIVASKGDGDNIVAAAPKQTLAGALRGDIRGAMASAVFTGVLGKTGDVMNMLGIPGGDEVTAFLANFGIGSADKTNSQVIDEVTAAVERSEARLRTDIVNLGRQVIGHLDTMKEDLLGALDNKVEEILGSIESAARATRARIADLDEDVALVADDVRQVLTDTADIHGVLCQMTGARIDVHFEHIKTLDTLVYSKLRLARNIECSGSAIPESYSSLMQDIETGRQTHLGRDSDPTINTVKADLNAMTQCIVNSGGGFSDVFARHASVLNDKVGWSVTQKLNSMELLFTWYLHVLEKGDAVILAKLLHEHGDAYGGVTTAFELFAASPILGRKQEVYDKFWNALNNHLFGSSPGTRNCPASTGYTTKYTSFRGSDGYPKCYLTSGNSAEHALGEAYAAMVNRISQRFGTAAVAGALKTSWGTRFCGLSKQTVCSGGSRNYKGCWTGASCSSQWFSYSTYNPCVSRHEGNHLCCSYYCGGGGGYGGGRLS